MAYSYKSLLRKRVYADPLPERNESITPLPALNDMTTYRWVEFHQVERQHIYSTWDVSAMVFWKGNIRTHRGHRYLRLTLVDEQGTKMEAVAYGEQNMRFNNLLHEGQVYDFMRVGFAPTYAAPLEHILRLCADYFVVLSSQTIINTLRRTFWISQTPFTFMEFEDVYRQRENMFADVIGLVVYVSDIQHRGVFWRRPSRHVVLLDDSGHYIIVHVKEPHLQRHVWQWRPASSKFRTLAALHVKVNMIKGGVTSDEYSQFIFSPVCSKSYDLKDLRKSLRVAERRYAKEFVQSLVQEIMDRGLVY
ncbi:unnamed protein product [Urochloa decumbens]|uniref:Uncharacterized protein n=1 Tax=Urochloa decumbens TaxID=240449 RepID=A0ABC8XZA8_9POAL